MLWTIVPLLRTVTTPALATFDVDRSMANSDSAASTASEATAVAAAAVIVVVAHRQADGDDAGDGREHAEGRARPSSRCRG